LLNYEIIDKIGQWLGNNSKIEIKYRKQCYKDFKLDSNNYYEGTLYQLWQEEADTEDFPLILIDYEKNINLYLATSYNDENSNFEGYLICTLRNNTIYPSKDMDKLKIKKDLWTCSIGIISPNEIVLYEEVKDLDDGSDDHYEFNKEKYMDNYVESKYIDIFYSTSYHSFYYAYLAITDFNQKILSFEEFLDLIIDETRYTFPKYENREDIEFTFGLYYLENNELNPLTKNNYYQIIETPNLQVFFTEDPQEALILYNEMLQKRSKWEEKLFKKVEKHQRFIDSLS
jgi:hypothetical protein